MKVILLENIEKIGQKGDLINVKKGFARNYLIPRKYAIYATPQNLKKLSSIKEKMAAEEEQRLIALKSLAEKIAVTKLVFVRKTDENEHLFGSVSENDVVHSLKEMDIEIHKSMVLMDKHIRVLGEHPVQIKLHKDISANLIISIEKEQE